MPKGYWIGRVDVAEPEAFKAYITASADSYKKFGAHFLVRNGSFENPEGSSRTRNVVIGIASVFRTLSIGGMMISEVCDAKEEIQR